MSFAIQGARAVLSVNNTIVAIASNASYNWRHETQDIEVIDEVELAEIAITGIRINFSMDTFRVLGISATSLGIQPTIKGILTHPELTIVITDKLTQAPLLYLSRVVFTGRSGRVGARSVWVETLSFKAIKAFDEGSFPSGNGNQSPGGAAKDFIKFQQDLQKNQTIKRN